MTRKARWADAPAKGRTRKDAQLAPGTVLAHGPGMPHSSRPRLRAVTYWLTVVIVLLAVVGVWRPISAQSQSFGLEWPGNGAVRRMLYWSNPPPIYPWTYVFKAFPRKKSVPGGCSGGSITSPTGYYTMFFWG